MQEQQMQQANMQQGQAMQVDDIMSQLTPEEQQAIQANPALLDGLGV